MARPTKNKGNQILFTMTKSGDGSYAAGATPSQISVLIPKYFGVNHGSAAVATSGIISRLASTVSPGIFRQSLKAAECNFDMAVYRFKATSCAEQVIPVFFDTFNDVDTSAQISDIQSYLVGMSGMLSDVHSGVTAGTTQATAAASRALYNQSAISNMQSYLVGLSGEISDVYSAVGDVGITLDASDVSQIAAATASQVAAAVGSSISDIQSYLVALSGQLSDVQSAVAAGDNSATLASIYSLLSNVDSVMNLTAYSASGLISAMRDEFGSEISDTLSSTRQGASQAYLASSRAMMGYDLTSDLYSLVDSRVPGVVATSSDIVSQISVLLASDISDILSAARAGGASDSAAIAAVYSLLSDTYALDSAIGSEVTAILARSSDIYSLLSDTASQVAQVYSATTTIGADVLSHLVGLSAELSDVYSGLADVSVTLGAADISQIASQVAAAVGSVVAPSVSQIWAASDASSIRSAAQQANSRALLLQSEASDVYSLLTTTRGEVSDVQAYLLGMSATLSDIYSLIGSPAMTGTSAALSDIYSRLAILGSNVSDIQSYLVGLSGDLSNVYSNVVAGGAGLGASDISLIAKGSSQATLAATAGAVNQSAISDLASYLVAMSAVLSDVHSAAIQANARALVIQSQASDVYSLLTDVNSDVLDIQSNVVDVQSNVLEIQGHIDAGVTLTAAGAQAAADEFLNRNLAGGGSGNTRNVRNALRPLRNKVATNAATSAIRIYAENDTTVAWSGAISTLVGNPITTVDPT